MPKDGTPGKPTTRRYTEQEQQQAVRLVQQARAEGRGHGAVQRVADQLGYGVESVRKWVQRADVDAGLRAGTSSEDRARIKELEAEVKELRRANSILKSASAFFAAELARTQK